MNCNEINAHCRDRFLEFEEAQHRYTLHGRELRSVTTIVEEAFPQFDCDYWAARKAAERGVDPETLKQEWEQNAARARNLGTAMHARIESHYLGLDDGDTSDAMLHFRQFTHYFRLNPFRTEWRIYNEDYGIAGTLDMLDLTDGVFTIWDWKRSKKLINPDGTSAQPGRFTGYGIHAATCDLPDMSFYHYSLQLSIYRLILAEKYGIDVSAQRLGIFHPAYDRFYVLDVPFLRDRAMSLLRSCRVMQPV